MPLCQDYQRPLTLRDPRFCPVCVYPPSMQELAKYGVHEILASLQPHVEADQHAQVLEDWLIFQWEVGQMKPPHPHLTKSTSLTPLLPLPFS